MRSSNLTHETVNTSKKHRMEPGLRVYAIGDIHGCSVALKTLLDAIAPTSTDTVISLGDIVDRGDNSKAAIEMLMDLRDRCNFVLIQGNHELPGKGR